jgi:hypothetical protein
MHVFFLSNLAHFFLIIINVSDEGSRGNQNTRFAFNNLFFRENRAVYEIMWKNTVDPGWPQMTIWRIRVACWIPKSTNTHSEYNTYLLFDLNNGCTNTPQYYVIRAFSGGPGSSVGIASGYGLDGPGIESQWGRDFPHL